MGQILEINGLTKAYKDVTSIYQMSFTLKENKIYGLLGRNGAGKTTLMHMITAQLFPTCGDVKVFGEEPYENTRVLQQICFIKESQAYPEYFQISDVFATAKSIYPNWNDGLANQLTQDFQLPLNRRIKELSRGMLSSVGIVVGLASRAPLTIFDEPYLGLDAVARGIFYDRLIEDYAEYPRTVILSTHLIDEVSQLLEHVLIIERGELLFYEDAESLRSRIYSVSGSSEVVETYMKGKEVIHVEKIGSLVTVTLLGKKEENNKKQAESLGLEYVPISLQKFVVDLTTKSREKVVKGQ
ncbi:ABC transporter ATP-binding protein [Shimazuella alba]|uniref:ATP-binding cassette domain-containing protein n=1 Tax=Shimazuella alba TaxID=2690964 RepID=A0A6I4VNK3_9BACL|nr:ABC transporter ATP-binding protein [Shimazuella alba]MXQ52613.1 ATP-binding cassette domain-containing protein [Shimazuella alba]